MKILLLVLAACSSRGHADDPVVGKWGDHDKVRFTLLPDGALDKPPTIDLRCEQGRADAVIAACRAKQTWDHDGTTVTLRMAVVSQTAAYTAAQQMMAPTPKDRCECNLDPIEAEYRDDALVVGNERVVRIR